MRAVRAKRIRATARKLSVGMKDVAYIVGRPKSYVPIMSPAGHVVKHNTIRGIPTEMIESCTRSVYQRLKRMG